jgi:hypothetical protein
VLVGQFEFVEWTGEITSGIQSSWGCGRIELRRM